MREALHFTFNNRSSEDMGVVIASPNGGLFQENFLPTRRLLETSIRGKDKRYFQGVETDPLSFSLTFFIEEWRDRDNLRQISRWLFQDYYKPLWFDTNPEHIYYAIIEGSSSLIHNGCKDGYIELNVRCNSPFSYSPIDEVTIQSSVGIYHFYNEGDLTIKPRARIKKTVSKGDIEIKNITSNQTFKLTDIQLDEEIYIDFENEEIVSSLQYLNVYRYGNHNGTWLEMIIDDESNGENTLELTGDFQLDLEYEFVYLAE
ncbi:phage tail domain-containing protein [Bacillus sp. FJAT-22090]|uniref:phage tail domain-containing protein n=1 Tax=Bacillus sp. FJAT-22090 TaxID=1581038 RepID=UPI0016434DB9|nr:phage tail domain-containing protein [Bacillus sp. FJAT-22090]